MRKSHLPAAGDEKVLTHPTHLPALAAILKRSCIQLGQIRGRMMEDRNELVRRLVCLYLGRVVHAVCYRVGEV